jgi:hypothetical protein
LIAPQSSAGDVDPPQHCASGIPDRALAEHVTAWGIDLPHAAVIAPELVAPIDQALRFSEKAAAA